MFCAIKILMTISSGLHAWRMYELFRVIKIPMTLSRMVRAWVRVSASARVGARAYAYTRARAPSYPSISSIKERNHRRILATADINSRLHSSQFMESKNEFVPSSSLTKGGHVNLAEFLDFERISAARTERSGRPLEQLQRLGVVSTRVHLARAPIVLLEEAAHASSEANLMPKSKAERIVNAIKQAGRHLTRREICDRGVGIPSGSHLDFLLRKLVDSGTITRTGEPRHYLFGIAEHAR
jgi:hypothetical protein